MHCREVIKVSELSKRGKELDYTEKVRMTYERIKQQEIKSVGEEWKVFRETVLKCATEVCGCRRVGHWIRKGSEWWNEKVRLAV